MIERWDDRKWANGMIKMTDRPTELRWDDKRWNINDREVWGGMMKLSWDDRRPVDHPLGG